MGSGAGQRRAAPAAFTERGREAHELRLLPLAEIRPAFDAAATADLPLGYPVVEPPITHPLDVNFGDLIRLEGYDLAYERRWSRATP